MGVIVAVLSLGFAFAMSLDKPNKAEAEQNGIQKQVINDTSSTCGCQKQKSGDCGCTEKNKCGNFVDVNKDGVCDCGGNCQR